MPYDSYYATSSSPLKIYFINGHLKYNIILPKKVGKVGKVGYFVVSLDYPVDKV